MPRAPKANRKRTKNMTRIVDELGARCTALERDVSLLTSRERNDAIAERVAALEDEHTKT